MENRHLTRARNKGVNPFVYWIVRALFQPFFHLYFRMSRIGREHIPADGPVIFAANHRSFLDPFVIACMSRRPLYYVAKKELFAKPLTAWFLNSLGAFPIDRGAADQDAMSTAREILQRGDSVLIFPEGTRIRPGTLGSPKRGVGRLALETGAPVVPVAVIGTENIRRGWRIRPHKVSIRAGAPLRFPTVAEPSPQLAQAVTERIWPCVMLQWEWLGGLPPIRRAAVLGAGSWGTGLAVALARAGVEVDLGTRTAAQATALQQTRVNDRYLPGEPLPDTINIVRCADLELGRHDLVVLAVPARALPELIAAHGAQIPQRAGLLVAAKGLVAPHGTTPSVFIAQRTGARAIAALGGPAHAADALDHGAALVVASADRGFRRQLTDLLNKAGLYAEKSSDTVGVELAGAAKNAAALAAATAAPAGPNAVGAAAGRVFAEVDAYARQAGAQPETFAGLAGAGDLVATVLAQGSRNRRAGELLAAGTHPDAIEGQIGQTPESLDALPLLAHALAVAGVDAPTVEGLAAVVEGTADATDWAATITAPPRTSKSKRFVRAA
ncbi:1-acylglycerol-3-phosphate O-acyltransferase [Conexibacter woesei]|uniref:1-acylglycerol-3-phosphate O-acyltransferase n=1 Tax=Conexibacter woesei TaxID=191495 RepID=UPI00040E9746|nr:1-acylglycerol-3-phosphate O-acyltransferase [Conexibacter woesei]